VALFNHGRIGFAGTVDELSARVADKGFAIEIDADGVDLAKLLAGFPGVTLREKSPDGRWQLEAQSDIRPELARRIVAEGGALKSLDAHRLALGEAYTRYFEEASHEEA
jgi:ABC-2 type transport system ATP-binding protein